MLGWMGGGGRRAGVEREGAGGALLFFAGDFLGGGEGGCVEMCEWRGCDVCWCEGE